MGGRAGFSGLCILIFFGVGYVSGVAGVGALQ